MQGLARNDRAGMLKDGGKKLEGMALNSDLEAGTAQFAGGKIGRKDVKLELARCVDLDFGGHRR